MYPELTGAMNLFILAQPFCLQALAVIEDEEKSELEMNGVSNSVCAIEDQPQSVLDELGDLQPPAYNDIGNEKTEEYSSYTQF